MVKPLKSLQISTNDCRDYILHPLNRKNAFNPAKKRSIPPHNVKDKEEFGNCYCYYFYKQQEKKRSSPLRKQATQATITFSEQ